MPRFQVGTQRGWNSSSELRQQGAGFTGTGCQETEDKPHRGGHQVGKGVGQGKLLKRELGPLLKVGGVNEFHSTPVVERPAEPRREARVTKDCLKDLK